MSRVDRVSALTVALATALVVSACGQGGQPAGTAAPSSVTSATGARSSTAVFNDADVAFATDMIPHHAQAVQMADMALTSATSPEVKKLAGDIKAAQDPEIRTMSGWLVSWGKPVPATMGGHDMGSMHSAHGQGGMMSTQEMDDLGRASGASFDRMWLQMMIRHHEGAVAMARTELGSGSAPQAKQLAQAIIDSQTAEIQQMTSLLGSLKS